MAYEKAICTKCGFESNEFFAGGIGKQPGHYAPVACKTTKEFFSVDIFSKKIWPEQKVNCDEKDRVYYFDKNNKKEGLGLCPNCGEFGISFKLTKSVKLD